MLLEMSEIKLVKPTMEYEDEIWDFRQEIINWGDKDEFVGFANLIGCKSPKEWISTITLLSSQLTCPDSMVPSDIYIAVGKRDKRIVGMIDLRHHINHPIMSTWGGHISYYVRPSERNKGYATEMLRQNLLNCKKLNISRVLITCDEDNYASEKVILNNGGVFESKILAGDFVKKRYWINL